MLIQGRIKRLIIGVLCPPTLGALSYSLFIIVFGKVSLGLGLLIISIPIAFLAAGIQSLIFSICIEFLILTNIKSKFDVLSISTLLGAISGGVIGAFNMLIGAMVGYVVGLYLYKDYHKKNKPSECD